MSLFDFLFPKRCVRCKKFGSYICTNCFSYISFSDTMICTVCNRQAMGGLTHPVCQNRYTIDGVFSSLVYKGVVKKLIYTFKYPPYLTDMQSQLNALFYEGIIQKEQLYPLLHTESILIPIPLHKKKLRKRGYNQAELLAKGLSQKLNFRVVDCLERVRETKTQVGLSKEDRAENIKNAFGIKQAFLEQAKEYKQVFLVDDVATSGATLGEAAKILKKAGVKKVWGLTLARGD